MPEPRVRRAGDRFRTDRAGITTWHSFSHGDHYDPDNVAFGALLAINEEHVPGGGGYAAHRHADVEIVTWVLEGALAHADTSGRRGVVRPGTLQRLSAGPGAEHTETNASGHEQLVFVQTVLRSEHPGDPEHAVLDVPPGPGLHAGVEVHAAAECWVARSDGEPVVVPAAPRALVHVTRGVLRIGDTELGPGDELRSTAGTELVLAGTGEALVWRL